MKQVIHCSIGLIFIFPLVAFCEAMPVDPAAVVVQGDEYLKFLIKSFGGMKGAGTLALVAVGAQIIMKGLQVKFLGKMAGKYKFLAIYLLNVVGGVSALMISGITFLPALMHANTLAAGSLLAHQAHKQFVVKGKEKPSA